MKAKLPFERAWSAALREVLGPDEGRRVLQGMRREYPTVLAQGPRPAGPKRRLGFHFRCSIAPNLAAYRVMRARGIPDPVGTLTAVFDARLRPLVALFRRLARVPVPWSVLGPFIRFVVPRVTPSPGWTWQVASTRGAVMCNAHSCFYHHTYTRLGAPELTAISCHGDDLLFSRLPGGATMVRTGTIGRGHTHCDFRFQARLD